MKPDVQTLVKVVREAIDTLKPSLFDEIDRKVEAMRRSVWTKPDWCCDDMREFAMKVWGVSKPVREADMSGLHLGSVAYQLRGHHVNYCPFCGVKVS